MLEVLDPVVLIVTDLWIHYLLIKEFLAVVKKTHNEDSLHYEIKVDIGPRYLL